MERLNLATYAKEIKTDYDAVVDGDLSYAIFTTMKDSALKPTAKGTGDITDFVSEFEEGSVQFGIIAVNPFGSDVKKLLLVGWVPDSAPLKSKVSFPANVAEVGKSLHYHVQVTARDFDDLDVKDLIKVVSDAAGARYSIQSVTKASAPVKSFKPKPKPASPQPVETKAAPKPTIIKPKPTPKPAFVASSNDDDWDGEEEPEVRDFDEKPLEKSTSAYKPTKVDINALRKGVDSSTSSGPSSSKPASEKKEEEYQPAGFKERMSAYVSLNSEDGRLTSMPKPKIENSVSSRYSEKVVQPEFGRSTKVPTYDAFGVAKDTSKLVGGASRAFGTENGRTPAEIWAEKRGKFKEVASDEAPVNAEEVETPKIADVQSKFSGMKVEDDESEEEEEDNDDEWDDKPTPRAAPAPAALPARSLPPRPIPQPEPEPEAEEEEEEEEEEPEEEPEEEVEEEEKEAPAEESTKTAIVDYAYEKDEDNEIDLVVGELITNIKEVDESWWFGINSKGESGLFPAEYVIVGGAEVEQEPEAEEEPEQAEEPAEAAGATATADYDYTATDADELSFKIGDVITDIEKVDEGWWLGTLNGDRKLFPANYVIINE